MSTHSFNVQQCIDAIKIAKVTRSNSFDFSFKQLNDADLAILADEFRKRGVNPKELNLRANRIKDVSPLKDFDLLALDIRANPVKDITALASQTNLLTFRADAWTDFSPVSSALRLETLECGSVAFFHLWKKFYNLPNLHTIQFFASVENGVSEYREDVHIAHNISQEIIERNVKCLLAISEGKLSECRAIWNEYATKRGTPSYEALFEKTARHELTFFGSPVDDLTEEASISSSPTHQPA